MAMFRDQKIDNLESKYKNGIQYNIGNHSFKLILKPIVPFPTDILQYDWKVILSDGYECVAPMGAKLLSYPETRLEVIIERLKDGNRYNDNYLANAINEKIDEVYREYGF
ncbi:hypothetical protein MM300_07420 [Evansella sp. LMS18]|uniref:hypothetical protein n=1 Tax=Evansella sp. LMS18 TaxID=2924033 RepID=UPI0020D1CB51|nr:hypothetical protein [Evansella sp. LMS18]UTR12112.1 hypothetical protein MM300_07420 [Evansella sp. LMS18]